MTEGTPGDGPVPASAATARRAWMSTLRGQRLIPLLFLFSLLKFTLVVLWFMHLKFDSRTYARFFVLGLAGAITLYLIVLLTFRVFGG